jgi:hypothetical protein
MNGTAWLVVTVIGVSGLVGWWVGRLVVRRRKRGGTNAQVDALLQTERRRRLRDLDAQGQPLPSERVSRRGSRAAFKRHEHHAGDDL